MKTLSVEIWSDVMCPWCAVGYTQFAKAIEALKGELDVEVRWMPFELNPDLPPEGRPQDQHLAEVYGRSPEEVAAMRAQMQATAARAGSTSPPRSSVRPPSRRSGSSPTP